MTDMKEKIRSMKQKKDAIILAHYYQRAEVQDVADFVGDSYYLSKMAVQSEQQTIIFCGVRFMAESAKLLSPQKTVRLPVRDAGCPMAAMADANKILALKQQHPDAVTVCYINSPASVKALCDVCVTSSNALEIIKKLPQRKVIFLPDQNLSAYIAGQCKEKEFIRYPGYCVVHNSVTAEDVLVLKEKHPGAPVAAHPECRPEVLAAADFIGSTEAILRFVHTSQAQECIIITEEGIRNALENQNSGKQFYFPEHMLCEDMKKTTLEDILRSFEDESTEIELDAQTMRAAAACLRQMHLLSCTDSN
ncbi:MAG: quinolinate synthase NadA [Clostridiales bacterium]|jgi:quinolinate synthase|nr:quinolinate synthase NadA [Clostridiales bacterium]